jgi:tetratricopeptide (TPR) repeat protein
MHTRLIIRRRRIAAAAVAAIVMGTAAAAARADSPSRDTPSAPLPSAPAAAPAAAPGGLEEAEFKVNAGDFRAAIPLLSAIVQRDPRNADALNLMGYSLRKTGQFALALQYYNSALAIAPQNLGANEYLGELYVQMGQIEKARQQLAVLTAACGADCVQTRDLTAAIAKGPDQ